MPRFDPKQGQYRRQPADSQQPTNAGRYVGSSMMQRPNYDYTDVGPKRMPAQSLKVNAINVDNSDSSTIFHSGQKMSNQKELLTEDAITFLCNHYEITKDVRQVLSSRFQNDLTKVDKEEIYLESYNNIIEIIEDAGLLPVAELKNDYVQILIADIVGYGVLESLLNDPSVTEIMVVQHDRIFAERNGKLSLTDIRFPSVENALGIVKRIVEPLGKRIDTMSPNVDAQMKDGSRLSASIAPLRLDDEISITIRKFSDKVYPLEHYVEKYASETFEMANFLESCVKAKQSIIVSGGTGSGKTTLLNSVSFAIPDDERILTIEDTPELKLQQPNLERYQTVEANQEGKGGVTIQEVMVDTLRKRPDRIIVGECRGGEIVEMINAMNTGHEGSMSTVHANTPEDMIQRCVTMVRSNPASSTLDERTIHEMLNSALDLIVQTTRLDDGSRRIVNIAEVVGVGTVGVAKLQKKGIKIVGDPDPNRLYLQDVFRFVQTSIDESGKVHGHFEATGYIPYCNDKLRVKGIGYPDNFFKKRILQEV